MLRHLVKNLFVEFGKSAIALLDNSLGGGAEALLRFLGKQERGCGDSRAGQEGEEQIACLTDFFVVFVHGVRSSLIY